MAELIDVLTPAGQNTGIVREKDEVHRRGDWHQTVHIWVTVNRREVLLQKRSRNKINHPGLWDLSCAGHIASGETPLQAGIRELQEELGIQAAPEALEFLYKQRHQWVLNGGRYKDNEWNHVYLLDLPKAPAIRFRDGEVEAAEFMPWQDLEKKVYSRDPALVSHWESYERLFGYMG